MTYSDKEKLRRLKETFSTNFRLTQMYAEYLERYPEIITKDMIEELCRDTDIKESEAIAAILSEIFLLDDSRGGEDRRLIRSYIYPSVRVLDSKKYTDNKYLQNVAPKEATLGAWEIKWEYYPPYRAAICDDMVMGEDFLEYPPIGFFTDGFSFPAVLEGGNEWMTLTPVDVDTCERNIEEAHGSVVTFGLGLGYYTYMVSERCEVESVTVVERSAEVISLFKEHILPRFSHPEKVRIVNSDAFEYAEQVMPKENFDYAFVDTWRDASDGLPMYERMKALEHLSPKTEFSYWIEGFILSRKRALKYSELISLVESDDPRAPKTYNEFVKELTK